MTPKELHKNIRSYCEAHADAKVVKKYSRYFKGGYDAYGLTQQLFDEKVFSLRDNGKLTLRLVLETAPLLLKSGKFEKTSFAIYFLKQFRSQYTKKTLSEIAKWFDVGITNWAHADAMSADILSCFLLDEIVALDAFASWLTAKNKYQRRVVPVALIKVAKENKDVAPLLKFVEPLMMDEAREVDQGVGWFLREAWKLKKAETENFLLKWKDKSPRLIFQYATEKMTAKEKERFRREK